MFTTAFHRSKERQEHLGQVSVTQQAQCGVEPARRVEDVNCRPPGAILAVIPFTEMLELVSLAMPLLIWLGLLSCHTGDCPK